MPFFKPAGSGLKYEVWAMAAHLGHLQTNTNINFHILGDVITYFNMINDTACQRGLKAGEAGDTKNHICKRPQLLRHVFYRVYYL